MVEAWIGLRCVHVSLLIVVILSLRVRVPICLGVDMVGRQIGVCVGRVFVNGVASRGGKGRGAGVGD